MSSGDLIAPPHGASGRALPGPRGRPATAVGPPPWPVLVAPLSTVAVQPHGAEVELVAEWMARPHVDRFWHQSWPLAGWSAEVARQHAGDHSRPWLVLLDRRPLAYVEVYRVARDIVAARHPVGPHDLGVHIAVGDPDRTGRGLGSQVLAAVAGALLASEHACGQIIGDPDAAHHVARRAFAAAGFAPLAEVDLPHKRAALLSRRRPPAGRAPAEAGPAGVGPVEARP